MWVHRVPGSTPVKGEQRRRGHPVGPREQRSFGRIFYTPYWTTFELPPIDVKAASVGLLDQIVAGLRQWSHRRSRGGSVCVGGHTGSSFEHVLLRCETRLVGLLRLVGVMSLRYSVPFEAEDAVALAQNGGLRCDE
jgi:hypothetical protein